MPDDHQNTFTGAETIVRMLESHGVQHIFGLCGDTTLPFYDALYQLDHGMTHILTRDERSAAYMADGYARVTGRPGICEGPSGGGATYILPGLVEAFGVTAFRADDPETLETTLRQAINHPGPTLVDVISQPLQDANAPVSEWIA